MIKINNKFPPLELIAFIFTMMFSFEVNEYNMRYIVLAFWLIVSLFRNSRISRSKMVWFIPIGVLGIAGYSFFITMILGENDYFELLRCMRAVLTFLIIILYLYRTPHNLHDILHAVSFVLLLHALCIILGVLFPSVKDFVLPISQYTKEFLAIRSSGFLSGFDDAGFICNIGLVMTIMSNHYQRKKIINMKAIVFITAVILTSRFNILLMGMLIVLAFLMQIKSGRLKGVLNIGKYIVVILVVVGVVWILTTNVSMVWREELFSRYTFLRKLYDTFNTSYTDYGIHTSVISRHISIKNLTGVEGIFGAGYWNQHTDVGYLKTIFAVGAVGLFTMFMIYLISILNVHKIKKIMDDNIEIKIGASIYITAVAAMFIMETKSSLIFSSTTFELLSVIYLGIIYEYLRNRKNR